MNILLNLINYCFRNNSDTFIKNNMEPVKPLSLFKIFKDEPQYAWELLDRQVEVQTCATIDGKDIAQLLSLYMRGVEKLNSLQDNRQHFFQMRMTNLMMKPNVVKILSAPKNTNNQKSSNDQSKQCLSPKISMNYIQRTKQMQMQVQYNLSASADNLNKMLSQHNTKTQNVQNKINQVINEGQNRIEERIKAKKLKAQAARSQSESKLYHSSSKKMDVFCLDAIKQQPRSRKGSKIIKRKLSLQQAIQDQKQQQISQFKPRRKFTYCSQIKQ